MAIKPGSLKLNKSHLIILALMVLVCFLLIDRHGTKSNLKQSLKDLKTEQHRADAVQKQADEAIAALEASKRDSDERITKIVAGLSAKDRDLERKASRISELEAELPSLVDKDEIIRNQAEQISEWRSSFSLVQQKVDRLGEPVEKDGVIVYPVGSITFELNRKYETQLAIVGQWEAKYDAACAVRDQALNALADALKDLKRERLRSKAKTTTIAAAVGGALYLSGEKSPAYLTWALGLLNLVFSK